jgi:hypothetical protein
MTENVSKKIIQEKAKKVFANIEEESNDNESLPFDLD